MTARRTAPLGDMLTRRRALYAAAATQSDLVGVGPKGRDALLGRPRFRDRLARLRRAELGGGALAPEHFTRPAARLCVAGAEAMADLAIKVGAAWRAGEVLAVIDAADAAALTEALGADPRVFAARWSDDGAAPFPPADMAAFAEAVREDGWRCVAAWASTEPPVLAALLMALAPSPPGLLNPNEIWARADLCATIAQATLSEAADDA